MKRTGKTGKHRNPPGFSVVLIGIGLMFSVVIGIDFLWRGAHRLPKPPVWSIEDADPARGKAAIERFGCGSCHTIPGVRRARGRVGPQLTDFSNQIYIAGMLANSPDNLVAWITNPQAINPGTAMPNLNVTETEARDIAAYLYTLD